MCTFESAETKEQWLIDLEDAIADLREELSSNPFNVTSDEIDRIVSKLTD